MSEAEITPEQRHAIFRRLIEIHHRISLLVDLDLAEADRNRITTDLDAEWTREYRRLKPEG